MNDMQFPPSPALSGIVKHYLVVERATGTRLNYRLFSDGNPGIVFHFGDPLIQEGGVAQPRSFVYGQISRYNDLLSGGRLGMLVVVLQPYGLYSLLRMAAHELNDGFLQLSDLFGQEAVDLEEQVMNGRSVQGRIRSVEGWLLKRGAVSREPDPILKEALQFIYDSRGVVRIEDLIKRVLVTERQLERKFKEYIGTGPKKMADIIKFQHFLKRLQQHPSDAKISDIIYDGGYYDPAHLNNYFKRMAGITPGQYKTNPYLLAVNFMQVPGG